MAEGYEPHSERGSNSSGQYVKMEDGTLIEWGRVSVTVPANSYAEATIGFPKSFSEIPSITLTPEIWAEPKYFSYVIKSTSAYNPSIRVGNEHSTELSITINWTAVGKA